MKWEIKSLRISYTQSKISISLEVEGVTGLVSTIKVYKLRQDGLKKEEFGQVLLK